MAEDDAQLDTDTLLAMLQSLLHGIDASQTELLEALLASDGDVEAAAALLRREGTSSSVTKSKDSKETNRKRKRATSLANWLQKPPSTPKPTTSNSTKPRSSQPPKKAKVIDLSDSESDTTTTPSKSSRQPDLSVTNDVLPHPNRAPAPSPSKPVRLITDVLRPPEPSRPVLPKLPPLTLGTAALVAQHTPCTLHSSILPPELACRLFYSLLDEANQHWRRNKWFLGNVFFLGYSPVPLNHR